MTLIFFFSCSIFQDLLFLFQFFFFFFFSVCCQYFQLNGVRVNRQKTKSNKAKETGKEMSRWSGLLVGRATATTATETTSETSVVASRRTPLATSAATSHEGRHIGPLWHNLELSTSERGAAQHQRVCHQGRFGKFNVSIAHGVLRVLVKGNRNPVDGAACLEQLLEFLGCGAVVNIADVDAAGILILLILPQILRLLMKLSLHLLKSVGLILKFFQALFHGLNIFILWRGG